MLRATSAELNQHAKVFLEQCWKHWKPGTLAPTRTEPMDTASLLFDISRTDNTDWLTAQREEVEANECLSDSDRMEIRAAIDERFSHLNRMALTKQATNGGAN